MFGCARTDARWDEGRRRSVAPQDAELQRLREKVRQQPQSVEAPLRLAHAYLQRDRLEEATAEFHKALELDPDNVQALLGLSALASRLGFSEQAVALARQAAQGSPDDPEVWHQWAVKLMEAGRMKEAGKVFERLVAMVPRQPEVLLTIARYEEARGDWRQAETRYRQMAQATPGQVAPGLLLGDLYLRHGQGERALRELTKLARQHPDHPAVQALRGQACQAQGRLPEARAAFLQAQQLEPQWLQPYLEAGEVCRRLQDYAAAAQQFERALELSGGALPARLGLAEVRLAQGQTEQAQRLFEAILKEHPQHPTARNNLAYLYAEQGQNLERAYAMMQELGQLFPRDGAVRDTLGWVCYRAGRLEEARCHLEEAVRLDRSKALRHYHLGQVEAALEQRTAAAAALRTALKLGLGPAEKPAAERLLTALEAQPGSLR
jgi:tetratricopeptide (TPR) repeat protein